MSPWPCCWGHPSSSSTSPAFPAFPCLEEQGCEPSRVPPPPRPRKTTPACLLLPSCRAAADETWFFRRDPGGCVHTTAGFLEAGWRRHPPSHPQQHCSTANLTGPEPGVDPQRAPRVRPAAGIGDAPWQGSTKDHRARRVGEILKQELNKASLAEAITLSNKNGNERTLPHQPAPAVCGTAMMRVVAPGWQEVLRNPLGSPVLLSPKSQGAWRVPGMRFTPPLPGQGAAMHLSGVDGAWPWPSLGLPWQLRGSRGATGVTTGGCL